MDSLFDDPAFVAALEKLDLPPYNPEPGEFGHRRTLSEWAAEEGLILDPPEDPFTAHQPVGPGRLVAALTFASLVLVGAAGAAAVFRDPLFRIIHALT